MGFRTGHKLWGKDICSTELYQLPKILSPTTQILSATYGCDPTLYGVLRSQAQIPAQCDLILITYAWQRAISPPAPKSGRIEQVQG